MRTMRAFRLRRRVWRVRRSVPRVVAQPLSAVLPAFAAPKRPILLVGCPRSGPSILLRALLQRSELRSIQSEGHLLCALPLFVRGRRFADQPPQNCLRLSYLDALFPGATFVFLRRRAADNVNSLLEGWRARPRFVTYRLPEPLEGLGPLSGDIWS